MQDVNAPLTIWTQLFEDRAGRLISQAKTILARAASNALAAARAALARFLKLMIDTHEAIINVAYRDKMAARRMFYVNPMSRRPEFTADGARTIARWIKHAGTFNHGYSSELNAEMKGMQKMLDLILADLLDDPIDFMQAMKAEEERRQEEIVSA